MDQDNVEIIEEEGGGGEGVPAGKERTTSRFVTVSSNRNY